MVPLLSPLPAFGGVPGGPELLIALIVLAFLVGVPVAAVAGLVLLFKLRSDDETADGDGGASRADPATNAERIAALEAEVARLRNRSEEETDSDADGAETDRDEAEPT